jgi:hypothetical protein
MSLDAVSVTQHAGFPVVSGQSTGGFDPGNAGMKPQFTVKTADRGATLEEQGFFQTGTLRSDGSGQLVLFTSPQDPTIPDSRVLLVLVPPQDPTPPVDGSIRNWRTTRVDILYQARREAARVIGSIGLPGLQLHANPPYGLANVPTWFWATVASGQLDPAGTTRLTSPWETTWEQAVTHCVAGTEPGSDPPVENPCAREETVWEPRRLTGVDTASIAAQLVATRAEWWARRDRCSLVRHQRSATSTAPVHEELAPAPRGRRISG